MIWKNVEIFSQDILVLRIKKGGVDNKIFNVVIGTYQGLPKIRLMKTAWHELKCEKGKSFNVFYKPLKQKRN